jgi:hypothetical protein
MFVGLFLLLIFQTDSQNLKYRGEETSESRDGSTDE